MWNKKRKKPTTWKERYWKLKKQYNMLMLCYLIVVFMVFYGISYQMNVFKDMQQFPPTVSLTHNFTGTRQGFDGNDYGATGKYYKGYNHIQLSLQSDDVCRTFFHEYGHYIYKRINITDKETWETISPSQEIEGYKKYELKDEWFAIKFSEYMRNRHLSPEFKGYMGNITESYIK